MTDLQTLIFDAFDAYLDLHATTWDDLAEQDAIFDGPQPVIPTNPEFVVVGCDDPTVDGFTITVDQGAQDWEGLGANARMETFTIWATYVTWTGDNDHRLLRANAKARIDTLGAALRPAPHGDGDAMLNDVLNQNGSGTGWCGLSVTRARTLADSQGVHLHVQYALTCTARL